MNGERAIDKPESIKPEPNGGPASTYHSDSASAGAPINGNSDFHTPSNVRSHLAPKTHRYPSNLT